MSLYDAIKQKELFLAQQVLTSAVNIPANRLTKAQPLKVE